MTSEIGPPVEDIDRSKLSIFQQDWWLKIAGGSARLEEVQIHSPDGVVVGRLPYIVHHSTFGVRSGGGGHLSRVIGPIIGKNLSDEEKSAVISQLIRNLPKISFAFSIGEHTPNACLIREAFKNAGFECFEQINYSQPPEDVTNRTGRKLWEHIKQARNKLDVIDVNSDTFINFYRTNLRLSGNKKSYFSLEIARNLIDASVKREPPQARIIAARRRMSDSLSEQPVLDAAICILWDSERCYYWLSTRRCDSHPNAIKLLIVEAMNHAKNMGLNFDADGVTTPGSQRLYKTIFRMPNEEKRYIFTRTSRWSKLHETNRDKIDKIKQLIIALGIR